MPVQREQDNNSIALRGAGGDSIMKKRRTAAVLAAILMVSLLAAGCGGRVSTTGIITGCVVKHVQAKSLSGPELQEKAVVIVPEPPIDSSYVGLPGVTVIAESTGYPSRSYIATTDRYGNFRMSRVEPGEYLIKIADDRFIFEYAIQCLVNAGRTTWVGEVPMGSLHVLSIGVSLYRDPALNLNYAASDAQLVAQVVGVDNKLAARTVTLCNYDATKARIRDAIISMGREMIPSDTFIMFFSGHGYQDVYEDIEYVVPHDYDGRVQSLIADRELNDYVDTYVPAAYKVFVFDSCHSGGMFKILDQSMPSGLIRSTGFEVMARNIVGPGKIVITACDKNEESVEGPQWGGGLFTWLFAGGMQPHGEVPYPADGVFYHDRDGIITTQEVFEYVEYYVPVYLQQVDPKREQNPKIYPDPGENRIWPLFKH
jgi:hypothetical protein